ncbi:MAG: hypothetical protein WC668_04460 [Patescibacteria group bacterium]|jgi:hypothetical protein
MPRKKQLRLTRRPGKSAFWIYEKDWEARQGRRIHYKRKPLVIQAYSEKQAVSFYVRTFLRQRGKKAIDTAENYFARLVKGGAVGSQTELPHELPPKHKATQ